MLKNQNMRVIHLCSYYIGNKLYKNMVQTLSEKNIYQDIYIPIKNEIDYGKNRILIESDYINYFYDNILEKHDKFFYFSKIKKQTESVEKKILQNKNINFIHAHTVFSDGGTAYKIKKKYGIDYLVTFRNTDINSFYKYGLHLRPFMYKILINSSTIVFLSNAYKEKVLSLLPERVIKQIKNKIKVIPNGIDNYWHINSIEKQTTVKNDMINLLFMGELNANKNLSTVLSTVDKYRRENQNIKLFVIGSGKQEEQLKKMVEELNLEQYVEFNGYIFEKSDIRKIMNKCQIFIMPSYKETFGLVYAEAMTQGLPVIYTKGQGFDGIFPDGVVGYAVDPSKTQSILTAIEKIKNNYINITKNCVKESKRFNWNEICETYIQLYKNYN